MYFKDSVIYVYWHLIRNPNVYSARIYSLSEGRDGASLKETGQRRVTRDRGRGRKREEEKKPKEKGRG